MMIPALLLSSRYPHQEQDKYNIIYQSNHDNIIIYKQFGMSERLPAASLCLFDMRRISKDWKQIFQRKSCLFHSLRISTFKFISPFKIRNSSRIKENNSYLKCYQVFNIAYLKLVKKMYKVILKSLEYYWSVMWQYSTNGN